MQKQQAPIHAAIDIGSNTVHLVVAHCTPDDLDIIKDEVELVRIGESVTATGEISQQKRQQTIETLRKYKALAEQHGAGQILVVATEAIRQASNSSEFLEDVERDGPQNPSHQWRYRGGTDLLWRNVRGTAAIAPCGGIGRDGSWWR